MGWFRTAGIIGYVYKKLLAFTAGIGVVLPKKSNVLLYIPKMVLQMAVNCKSVPTVASSWFIKF